MFLGVWLAHATNDLQSSYNLLNLPAQIKYGSTVKANYTYLSDGTKAAAYTSASAGKDHVGSFIYTRGTNNPHTLESAEALRGYAKHPAHVAVANTRVRPYTVQRACLDFEI